jgi:hypothetical protein
MRTHAADTYFETQAGALGIAYQAAETRGYEVVEPEYLWTEHVYHGTTTTYNLPLKVVKTGGCAKKRLIINLYRMDSGRYELNYYFS